MATDNGLWRTSEGIWKPNTGLQWLTICVQQIFLNSQPFRFYNEMPHRAALNSETNAPWASEVSAFRKCGSCESVCAGDFLAPSITATVVIGEIGSGAKSRHTTNIVRCRVSISRRQIGACFLHKKLPVTRPAKFSHNQAAEHGKTIDSRNVSHATLFGTRKNNFFFTRLRRR